MSLTAGSAVLGLDAPFIAETSGGFFGGAVMGWRVLVVAVRAVRMVGQLGADGRGLRRRTLGPAASLREGEAERCLFREALSLGVVASSQSEA